MPDFFGVYDDMKVIEYLEFFAAAYRIKGPERRKKCEQVLELVDLGYKRDALVTSLSRGMTQRLGLARVLLHEPQVLLLDEPASGLDPRARIEMRGLLKELRNMGKTILVSSHILPELADICNKIGIIERGKLLFDGDVQTGHPEGPPAHAHRRRRRRRPQRRSQADPAKTNPASMRSSTRTQDDFLLVTLNDGVQDGSFIAEMLVAERLPPEDAARRGDQPRRRVHGDHEGDHELSEAQMLNTYTAKYTKIRSGYMGQLVEWPEVITEGKNLDDCRRMLQDALQEMIAAYRQQHKEIPLGGGLIEQIPVGV